MPGDRSELFLACCLLEEPASFGRLDFELECAIGESGELDLERDVAADVGGYLIELLAELHHVDAEGTERLAHLGVWFCDAREDPQVDSGCLGAQLPL